MLIGLFGQYAVFLAYGFRIRRRRQVSLEVGYTSPSIVRSLFLIRERFGALWLVLKLKFSICLNELSWHVGTSYLQEQNNEQFLMFNKFIWPKGVSMCKDADTFVYEGTDTFFFF